MEAVVDVLGVRKSRNTIIGGFLRRGISGGERKRVSIGGRAAGRLPAAPRPGVWRAMCSSPPHHATLCHATPRHAFPHPVHTPLPALPSESNPPKATSC